MQRHRGRVDELNKWASWALQYYEEEQRRTGELDDAWWPLDEQGERLWGDPPGLSNGALDKVGVDSPAAREMQKEENGMFRMR